MGMYTGLYLHVALKMPEELSDVLYFMLDNDHNTHKPPVPNHPLFNTSRWQFMLRCQSAYFPECERLADNIRTPFDGEYLHVASSFQNYEDALDKFLDWIAPYVVDLDRDNVVGWYRYEEDEKASLIQFD